MKGVCPKGAHAPFTHSRTPGLFTVKRDGSGHRHRCAVRGGVGYLPARRSLNPSGMG